MKARHLILMLLRASGDKIENKTKIQKEIYFLSLLLNNDFAFRPYYYGPYSLEVEQGLDELVGAGFVDVKQDLYGMNMKHGITHKKYTFTLSDSGRTFADTLKDENPDVKEKVEEFVNKLKDIGDPDYLSLSIAAKAYFILKKEGKPMTKDQIIEKANEFGWRIDQNNINVAVKILIKLNFV